MKERPNEAASTADFEFSALAEAQNYPKALIREFAPFLKGRVIEIGGGIGQMTTLLRSVPTIETLQSIEPDIRFCEQFQKAHPDQQLICGTIDDLPANTDWDALFSVNVLEHIREDELELTKYKKLLSKRHGVINLFVPARQEIYAPIDADFGHHRRYSKAELKRKLEAAGFEIVRLKYFNCVGYLAWWFNFCVLRQRKFKSGSVKVYDRAIFPVVNWLETNITPPPFGQSLVAVARA
jgi:SAM-dependent methyltransferase